MSSRTDVRDLVVNSVKAKDKGKISRGACTELSRSIRNDKTGQEMTEMTITLLNASGIDLGNFLNTPFEPFSLHNLLKISSQKCKK